MVRKWKDRREKGVQTSYSVFVTQNVQNDTKQLLSVFTFTMGFIRSFTFTIKYNTSTIQLITLEVLYFCLIVQKGDLEENLRNQVLVMEGSYTWTCNNNWCTDGRCVTVFVPPVRPWDVHLMRCVEEIIFLTDGEETSPNFTCPIT